MALPPDILAGIARRLTTHAGLELPAWVVEARAALRIEALGTTPAAYLELISGARAQGELAALVEAVRTGESSLFRHRPQITALAETIAPALRAQGRRTLRVWSAGCASGEEPYTLAIVLARSLPSCAITILATDVSAEAIAAARRASYPRDALDDVPEEWRDAFVIGEDRITVRPELARLVTFEQANLVDATPPRGCDLVWCRNVLIYFSPEARRRAIDLLVGATAPGGYLFVGYSESLRDTEALAAERTADTVYYVRKDDPARRTPVPKERSTPPLGIRVASPATGPASAPAPAPAPVIGAGTAPSPASPRPAPTRAARDVLVLAGTPEASALTQAIAERLAHGGLHRLVIDLDPADLLGDELAPVLRRALAAAATAGVQIALRTTRPGPRRWLTRHGLPESVGEER